MQFCFTHNGKILNTFLSLSFFNTFHYQKHGVKCQKVSFCIIKILDYTIIAIDNFVMYRLLGSRHGVKWTCCPVYLLTACTWLEIVTLIVICWFEMENLYFVNHQENWAHLPHPSILKRIQGISKEGRMQNCINVWACCVAS